MIKKNKTSLIFLILTILLVSCRDNPTPKPRAFFRIDFPEKEYQLFDSTFPYMFEYPVYSEITPDPHAPDQPYWINVEFPRWKGSLHLSYKKVNGNLLKYLEDARTLANKHISKASSIGHDLIVDRDRQLFGMEYNIYGIGVASPYQFFVTDSAAHFVRGALYFRVKPNNDSLAPVIDFLKEDINHLINSFQWKEI